jgi:hypothetical protein
MLVGRPRFSGCCQSVSRPRSSQIPRESDLGTNRSHSNSAIHLVKLYSPPWRLRRCSFFLAMIPQRFVYFSAHPQLVQQHRQLSGHRHHSAFLGIAASPLGQFQPPSPQVAIFPKRPQDVVRALSLPRPLSVADDPPKLASVWRTTRPQSRQPSLNKMVIGNSYSSLSLIVTARRLLS